MAGAIPLLRPMRESLAGDRIRRVLGIVNGTTNYILTQMDSTGASFADALAEAQALGYAEADPTADVEGLDAAAKAAILASIAFHTRVTLADVDVQGITAVTAADVAAADEMGYDIKLLAIAELIEAAQRRGGLRPRASRRSCPRPTRWQGSATRSTPCSSRLTPQVRSCSTAAGPGARRPPAPCSATS